MVEIGRRKKALERDAVVLHANAPKQRGKLFGDSAPFEVREPT